MLTGIWRTPMTPGKFRLSIARAAVIIAATVGAIPAFAVRPLSLDDFYSIKSVGDVAASADGKFAVYVVQEIDREKDGRISSIWRVPLGGGPPVQLTRSTGNDRLPKYSPDGRFLAFVSN